MTPRSGEPGRPRPLIGCARMYASSASLAEAWRTLLTRISATPRAGLEVIELAYPAPLGPLVSQRRVLDAVLDSRADVGPVDSYLLDLWRCHLPEVIAGARVIPTTEPAPSTPLVASPMIDEDTCARLTAALLETHRDAALDPSLAALRLARYVDAPPARFEVFLERQRAAESAEYPVLA